MLREEAFVVMDDLLDLMETLAITFDKEIPFHIKHNETAVHTAMMASSDKSNYGKSFLGTPVMKNNGEWNYARQKNQSKEVDNFDCQRCRC